MSSSEHSKVGRFQDVDETLIEDARVIEERGPLLGDAIERAQLPVVLHDGNRILRVNPALLGWLGFDGTDLVGAPLEALAAGEDPLPLLAALGASGEPPDLSHVQRFRSKSGEVRVAQVLARGSEHGDTRQTYALLQPWGTSLRPGELLHLLEAAVDQLHDIVFITEAESIDSVGRRIVFVNGAFSRATGFDPREVIGRTPNVTVGEGTERSALKRIEAGLRAGKPVHEQLQKYAKDGSSYWVDLTIIPVFDDQGKHTHWVSVQRDVTEMKRLQEKLLETERLASAGMLAAGLTHEINNPLTGVTMGLQWVSELLPALAKRLKSGAEAQLDQAELQAIATDLEAADGAVSDALEGAQRVESTLQYLGMLAGVQEESKQPLDVHNLLDTALEDLLHRSTIPGAVVRDYSRVPFVVGSEGQLVHMFHSLLLNAAQALTTGGEEKSRIVIRAFEDSRRRVCVEIEDTGIGIAPEVAKRLFSPFVSTRARGLGKGLGLFMAKEIVRSLSGELSYRTESGQGTTFTVLLPAGGAQGTSIRPAERSRRAIADARVLVVDPDLSAARTIRSALAPIKRLVGVSSRATALMMMEDASFDIVFASLSSPGLDGLELRERVAARATPAPHFIFVCDGTTSGELRQRAEKLGALLLDKPLERGAVWAAATSALGWKLLSARHARFGSVTRSTCRISSEKAMISWRQPSVGRVWRRILAHAALPPSKTALSSSWMLIPCRFNTPSTFASAPTLSRCRTTS